MSKKKPKKNRSAESQKHSIFVKFLLFLLFFVLTFAVAFGGILVSAYSQQIVRSFQSETYLFQLGSDDDSNTTKSYINADDLYFGGVLYLNMDQISGLCEFTVVGDHLRRTYFPLDDPSESVTFYFSSDMVEVNGENFRMRGEMFKRNGQIYVPADFFQYYCTGITLAVDEVKREIVVERNTLGTEYDPLDVPYQVYEEIDFLAERSSVIDPIKQGTVFSSALPVTTPVTVQ